MIFTIELEREEGRWIAGCRPSPASCATAEIAMTSWPAFERFALSVIAERLENCEAPAELLNVMLEAA
jgi:hypothetical protein